LSDKLSQSRFRVQSETQKPIEGILAAAKAIGISIAELSQNLGLAKSALIKLDRRLIDASTVPQKAIEKIAAAVSVSAESLRAYLNAPPTLGAGASYHSIDKPSLLSSNSVEMREPFESTLQTSISSGEMTREQAEEWL
jgi:lambda repressor-like predicted transcriptional regulator